MGSTIDPKTGRAWCPRCNMFVNTYVDSVTDSYVVKGKPIVITARHRFCSRCNEEVFDRELECEFDKIAFSENDKEGSAKAVK